MDTALDGNIAIVTGAAQGIGKEIARALHGRGATVLLADIDSEKGQTSVAELGERALFIPCDISDADAVHRLVHAAVDQFGRLDTMVNNAGINAGAAPHERVTIDRYSDELWHRIIDVDLTGTYYCCKAAAAVMVSQGSGSIINIASVAGVVALRLQVAFVAAKAGVIRMTEAMACELAPTGVRVNAVSPGSTLTEGTRTLFYENAERAEKIVSFIPQRRPADASEIAQTVVFLASDASSYVNGHNLIVDGGWTCGFNRDF